MNPQRAEDNETAGSTEMSPVKPTPKAPRQIIAAIEPGLFLGSRKAAMDCETLVKHNITAVVTVCRRTTQIPAIPDLPERRDPRVNHMVIRVSEDMNDDLLRHLGDAAKFIRSMIRDARLSREGGAVLVHSISGVSRAAAVVAAYLMVTYRISRREAVGLIQESRPRARPERTWLEQLNRWESLEYDIWQDRARQRLKGKYLLYSKLLWLNKLTQNRRQREQEEQEEQEELEEEKEENEEKEEKEDAVAFDDSLEIEPFSLNGTEEMEVHIKQEPDSD